MSDAVLVADGEGRIVNANRAAQRLLAAEAQGSSAAKNLAERPWLAELVVGEAGELDTLRPESIGEDQGRIVTVEVDAHTHHFDLRQSALRDRQGLSLIHISEPTRLGMISYAVFCLK